MNTAYILYRALRPTGSISILNKRRCWYDDPPASDAPADPPDTPPAETGETGQPGQTFTQAELDRIVGERARRASESAINKLLSDLGIESAAKLKAEIEAKRQRDETELSEQEKLNKRIETLEAEKQAAETAKAQAEQAVLETRRDSALIAALSGADKPKSVLTLLKTEHADDVASVLTDEGTVDEKTVTKLVDIAKKEYAGMFKNGIGPGTGSHSGGKIPTDKAVRDRIKQRIRVPY